MTTGFVFDTVLYKKNSDYYGMTLTYDFFKERYLDKTEKMMIITRTKKIEYASGNIDGYKITNGENVDVNPISLYNNIPDALFRKKYILEELKQRLLRCNNVIIRMPSVLGLLSCDICKKNNIPYMIEMVACAWDGYMNHTNKMGKIIAPFMYYECRKKILDCKYVLYVTNEFLQKRYPTNGKSFSCSDVVLPDFNNENISRNFESFDNKSFSMCTVANVGMKYKGHIYALRAIYRLKKKNINIKYYLAGNGNQNYLKKEIKKMGLEENVIFLGSLSHDKIFDLLDNIDIYIQPSLQEGLPRALIEAMSRGCCCIGSNVGGIPELLNKDFIFKRKNVKQLINIIESLNYEKVVSESKSNFKKTRKFSADYLSGIRNNIYINFFKNSE